MTLKNYNLANAVVWKYGQREGFSTVEDNGQMVITEWPYSDPQPMGLDVDNLVANYEAYLDSVAYQSARAAAYPDVEDQLDAIWKILQAGSLAAAPADAQAVSDQIQLVKKRYAKP